MIRHDPAFLRLRSFALLAVFLLGSLTVFAGCDSSSDDAPGRASLSISFATPATTALDVKRTLTDPAGNTLEIDQVDMVLEEVEFERPGTSDACQFDDDDSGSDDDCLEVETGPFALSLPLDGTAPLTAFTTSIPDGLWEEVEFEVEPIDDDEVNTLNTPVPVGQSIRVEGSYTPVGGTAEAFVWTTDIDGEQEIEFSPPIEVTADEPVNITFRVNVDNWFRRSNGSLINPGTIADDSDEEELVEDNIETSIEGYRDDDRDGDDDDDDSDDDSDDDDSRTR